MVVSVARSSTTSGISAAKPHASTKRNRAKAQKVVNSLFAELADLGPRSHGGIACLSMTAAGEDVRATDGRVPGRRGIATRRRLLDCTAELLSKTSYRDINAEPLPVRKRWTSTS